MVGLILSGEKEKKTREREIYFRIGERERESCLVHLEIVLEGTWRRHKTLLLDF
jgi:hypothetical protein